MVNVLLFSTKWGQILVKNFESMPITTEKKIILLIDLLLEELTKLKNAFDLDPFDIQAHLKVFIRLNNKAIPV